MIEKECYERLHRTCWNSCDGHYFCVSNKDCNGKGAAVLLVESLNPIVNLTQNIGRQISFYNYNGRTRSPPWMLYSVTLFIPRKCKAFRLACICLT